MTRGEELWQNAVEELELAGNAVQRRIVRTGRVDGALHGLEAERVVADLWVSSIKVSAATRWKRLRRGTHLAQLHDLVLQAPNTGGLLRVGGSVGEDHSVLLDLFGELDLQRTHLALDDPLDLVGEVRLDVLLQASEQERPEHLVQTTNDEQRLFFVQLDLVLAAGVGEGRIEPLVEALDRAEDFREHKVEQRPQLGQVVLQV